MEHSIRLLNNLFGLLLVVFLVNTVTTVKFSAIKDITRPQSYVSVNDVDKTLGCLAMNVYREAGNESFEGKVAVAQVTLNRVNDRRFPKDVCGVVYQKNLIMEKVVCQFSWHCDGVQKSRPINNDMYRESYAVAKKVLLEGFRLDMLESALFYHAVYVSPNWPYEKIGKIGNHIFYKART